MNWKSFDPKKIVGRYEAVTSYNYLSPNKVKPA